MYIFVQVKLFNEKRSDLEEQQLHLNVGLQKIRETVEQVEELQKSLSIKRNELEEKNNAANLKLKQMVYLFYNWLHANYCYCFNVWLLIEQFLSDIKLCKLLGNLPLKECVLAPMLEKQYLGCTDHARP